MTIAIIVCATFLFAQWAEHRQLIRIKGATNRLDAISERLRQLESLRATHYDPVAFEDLKGKVETLRVSQSLKVSR